MSKPSDFEKGLLIGSALMLLALTVVLFIGMQPCEKETGGKCIYKVVSEDYSG